jgi:hypothetical protein
LGFFEDHDPLRRQANRWTDPAWEAIDGAFTPAELPMDCSVGVGAHLVRGGNLTPGLLAVDALQADGQVGDNAEAALRAWTGAKSRQPSCERT